MLIWANKNEVDIEAISSIEKLYNKRRELNNLKDILKGWELSVIYRQIKRHFGERRDIEILDFGAGASPFPAFLSLSGYKSVTCLDEENGRHRKINEESYNKIYGSSIAYIKTDIVGTYIGDFDVIYSASVLEHVGEKHRIDVMDAILAHLAIDGLIIHVVDYDKGIDIKSLADNCGVSISYDPARTPGCEEFKGMPDDAWKVNGESRIAFFNEKEA